MRKKFCSQVGFLFFLLFSLQIHSVFAAIKIYDDKAEFIGETGAVDVIGSYPVLGTQTSPYTFQDGLENITIGAQSFFTGEATGLLPDIELRISYGAEVKNSENIDVTLADARYAFGFDMVEPSTNAGAPFIDSIFQIILLNNGAEIDSFTFAPPNDIASFAGVWSDEPFTEVKIREIIGSNENEHYGHFYTGSKIGWNLSHLGVTPLHKLLAQDGSSADQFGYSVAIDGDTALIGAPTADGNVAGSGAVYVFTRQGNSWIQQAKLVAADGAASDYFGSSVALSGNTALIGAELDDDRGSVSGSAYIFVRQGASWTQQAKLVAQDGAANDFFGNSVALDGNSALIGAFGDDDNGVESGSAYIFVRQGTSWTQQAKLVAQDGTADDIFGYSVALDSDSALIGASWDDDRGTDSGAAYVFIRQGTIWTQQAKLVALDGAMLDDFGFSVSLDGDSALIGAPLDDDRGSDSGSAYVFIRQGAAWSEQAKLVAVYRASTDVFGYSVALDDNNVIIGALWDDDKGTDSGSAYTATLYVKIGKGLSPSLQAAIGIAARVGRNK